jgi:hypothetical protein
LDLSPTTDQWLQIRFRKAGFLKIGDAQAELFEKKISPRGIALRHKYERRSDSLPPSALY